MALPDRRAYSGLDGSTGEGTPGIDAGILFQANQLSKGTVTRENHDMMLYGAHVRCSNYVSVLAGPMVGYVGETNAVIVIEVNAPSTLTCYVSLRDASTPEGRLVTSKTVNVRPGIPSKFLIDNLIPGELLTASTAFVETK